VLLRVLLVADRMHRIGDALAWASRMVLRHGPPTRLANPEAEVSYFHIYSQGPVGSPTYLAMMMIYGTKVRYIPHAGLQAHDPIQGAASLRPKLPARGIEDIAHEISSKA